MICKQGSSVKRNAFSLSNSLPTPLLNDVTPKLEGKALEKFIQLCEAAKKIALLTADLNLALLV